MTTNLIADTNEWFNLARPNPTVENFNVQLGVHVEEFSEMLEQLSSEHKETRELLVTTLTLAKMLAEQLKAGRGQCSIINRKLFLDAMTDQIVTSIGTSNHA